MLEFSLILNFSAILSFMYFTSYSITFILFFYIISKYTPYSTNLHQIINMLKYNKTRYYIFVVVLLAFLGIPPFLLFTAKFSSLVIFWNYSNFIFFFITLLVVFLSFALYVQLFDLLFKTNTRFNDNQNLITTLTTVELSSTFTDCSYKLHFAIISLTAVSVFGFFFFKDLFFCISIFF